MITDFHTHVFPDKIAAGAISKLEAKTPGVSAQTDGTVAGLRNSMKKSGIDRSVVLPVVTSPRQFDGINRFAAENNSEDLIFFGGIHPDCENIEEKLEYIKSLGLHGIKLHPDYQGAFIEDEIYVRIIRRALGLGLMITIHAGIDIGYPEPVHCSPERAAAMLDAVDDQNRGEPKIVLAHFGGHGMEREVIDKLCGRNVYFDTAFSIACEPFELLTEIIKKHGAEKILFASDSPWADQKLCVEKLRRLDLSSSELDMIMSKNAIYALNL